MYKTYCLGVKAALTFSYIAEFCLHEKCTKKEDVE